MESRKIGIVQNNMTYAINANDDDYDQYLRRNHAHKIEAIHAKHQGFDVCLLPMMDPQRMNPQNISEMALKEHCCRICAVRTRYLAATPTVAARQSIAGWLILRGLHTRRR